MLKKSIDGQRAKAGELQARKNSLHQIPCSLQQGRSIRQISIVIHVNAVIPLSDFQKRADHHLRGLCGASDYGPFSAHSPFFFRLSVQL